jgi:hypothetical protein
MDQGRHAVNVHPTVTSARSHPSVLQRTRVAMIGAARKRPRVERRDRTPDSQVTPGPTSPAHRWLVAHPSG